MKVTDLYFSFSMLMLVKNLNEVNLENVRNLISACDIWLYKTKLLESKEFQEAKVFMTFEHGWHNFHGILSLFSIWDKICTKIMFPS
jgi:hypothetical protein